MYKLGGIDSLLLEIEQGGQDSGDTLSDVC